MFVSVRNIFILNWAFSPGSITLVFTLVHNSFDLAVALKKCIIKFCIVLCTIAKTSLLKDADLAKLT